MAINSNMRPAEMFQLRLLNQMGARRERRSPTLFSSLADALRTAGTAYASSQITQGAQDRREAANADVLKMIMPRAPEMLPMFSPEQVQGAGMGADFTDPSGPRQGAAPIPGTGYQPGAQQYMEAMLNDDLGAGRQKLAEMLYKNSLPKPKEDITLAAGAIRMDSEGNVIGSNPKPIEKASTPLIIEAQQLYPNDAAAQQKYVLDNREKTPADNTPIIVREARFVHPDDAEAQRQYVLRNSQKSRALVSIGGKAPPGMHLVPDPENPGQEMLVPIKGSKQYLAASQARLSASLTFNNMMFAITELETKLDAGENITGVAGVFLGQLPQTESTNAKALISTIKANLGFKELGKMRASSPTGAGLGNVTEKEIAFLQATVANLDQAQTVEQFRKALNRIRKSTMFQRMFELYGGDATPASVAPETPATSVYNPVSGKFESNANKGAGK
jgi:hypothetical protein|tara:strand:- start:2124 stop:3461 length:1338 start_codon:yes stop_codon:yes gene_type:complete